MTRHGKNCTAGAVYTYHEKRKDTAASGYGTQSVRLGKDAIKDFDCCSLSLQPCRDPVLTEDGYLYEKEAILQYILHQKTEIAKKMKAYEKQKQALKSEGQLESKSEERERAEKFKQRENNIVSKPINPFTSGKSKDEGNQNGSTSSSSTDTSSGESSSSSALPSFWIPSLTPEAKPTLLKKPSKTVSCPMSGRPLKMSDLITVRFTPLDPSLDRVALLTRQDRYVCAVTKDTLGNSVPCAVLRPSGVVVTMECVEKLIKKDMVDPITGDKLKEKDIIPIQRGGTGFAGSGVDLKAKEARPVMQA
ncbi:nitric oxide synthase-interacting protein isoform X1 [Danio rerio]|uniref:Nitric oxide synthase-interacting protein n=2 Tax=Danio rerio TaxID=7955 RepID=NOSIP_DANRE|nr:nitric oxide synthase-interacting protein [Danio rerio]XP_005164079.1 nitric oxide synthase-interacting protein isoform X1 [Danio rerio]XP_009297811.1 nitric oxide synthase-interacting protein isoform X1 [Danio rerio]Q5U3S7.1 RecName: Full=Nitric oxide synthase-interacting protein; AltName: Full=E3 ubiquitin-protein ligase NOSIP; AltName: Full=RING-type E3 ubiquitin transferase NOSIP [Danio rerio]AAH85409.1 Nitric oxide synthase interacting protein [Danio rerio]AAI64074.1 Nosip protein [Dan|eukprot:NP_001007435.1 nitric oxide synthase-interacting protein [Danio rerio]